MKKMRASKRNEREQIDGKFLAIHANEGFQVPMSVYEVTLLQFLFFICSDDISPSHKARGVPLRTPKDCFEQFDLFSYWIIIF